MEAVPWLEGPADGAEDDDGDEGESVGLHVVPDDGAKLAAAEDEVEEAAGHLAAAEKDLAEVEGSVESLNARRLQLQGEADELRRSWPRSRTTSTRWTTSWRRPRRHGRPRSRSSRRRDGPHAKAEQALERLRSAPP